MDEAHYADLIERTLAAMADGDTVRAVALADQAVAERPDDGAVRNLRAQALLNMGASEEALQEAREAVALEPRQPESHLVLGMAAWEQGRLAVAQAAMERGLELSGREQELLARYAWFLACERGPHPAAEAAQEALLRDPHSVIARAALALVQLRQHRLSSAEQTLGDAEAIDPEDVHVLSVRIALLERQGRQQEAEQLAEHIAGHPAARELVDSVRHEAKQRRLAFQQQLRRPTGRPATPRRPFWASPLAFVFLIFFTLVVAMTVAAILSPLLDWQGVLISIGCLIMPLLLLIYWFRD